MNRYKLITSRLYDGDIILIENRKSDIVSDGIKSATGSRWSHTVWYKKPKTIFHWTTWNCKKDPLKRYIKDQYNICIMRYEGITNVHISNIESLAMEDVKNKRRYSKKAYLGYAIANFSAKIPFIGMKLSRWLKKWKNPWREANKRVCSSGIVRRWFAGVGIILCPDIGDEQTTPQDIYISKELINVYEEKENE